jgi:glycosyltransferase involved in cell wall biosynthesis
MIGRIAAYCAGTPIVIHTAHAFPFHASLHPLVRRLYVVLERWAARFADLIMVDTESVKQDGLRADVVQDHTKLVVVPMGIDLKKFSPSSHRPDTLRRTFGLSPEHLVVGTVARLVPDKGLECFLQMAALVRAARPDARFLIVGEGPLRQALEQQATALHLNEAVIFAGHRTDIPALMEVMDIFVLPTRREGFGVVFAEAMAMKKATVGSRIGPISEVVKEGVTGYLAEPDRPEEFARHVVELLGDASKRYAFGMAGRRRVEECFSESLMCERVETHYRRLLAHKGLAS